jgi:YegS/Rv2252/BmrU family lipid kinase
VVVLGGDGVVHEVANGLMRRAVRPHLAVIPMGSGNDFAATLGMAPSVRDAVAQIVQGREVSLDVGCVNGEHFVETLSFGLDAGIALGTNEWRQRTGWRGTPLYLASALDQLFHHFEKRSLHLELEDACALRYEAGVAMPTHQAIRVTGESYLFAIQLGPTYGGGFRIAPAALPDDGLFDLVIARPPLSVPVATGILLLAKGGHHTGFRSLEFYRARGVRVQVAAGTPIQVDGEALEGTEFDVSLLPGALCVLVGED